MITSDLKTVFVKIGKSSELSCNSVYANATRLTWSYEPYGTTDNEIVIYSMNDKKSLGNYEAFCQRGTQSCSITLLHAKEESAGRYYCKIATRPGQMRFAVCTIELIVGGKLDFLIKV